MKVLPLIRFRLQTSFFYSSDLPPPPQDQLVDSSESNVPMSSLEASNQIQMSSLGTFHGGTHATSTDEAGSEGARSVSPASPVNQVKIRNHQK